MKRNLFVALAAVALAVSAFGETDYKALSVLSDIQKGADNGNQIDTLRVRTGVVLPAGSIETADLAADSVSAAKIGTVAQVYTGATAIVTASYTPEFIGQALIGTVSNTVHIAENLTTNGWIQVAP